MQNDAELDPFFIASFFEELGFQWEIYDGKGICHNVRFNASAAKPLLTTGWDTLTSYYSWTGYRILYLYYYGQNQFFMLIDNNSNHERLSFFPPFHSLSTSLQHYRSFFMRIGVEDLTSTQLVSLFKIYQIVILRIDFFMFITLLSYYFKNFYHYFFLITGSSSRFRKVSRFNRSFSDKSQWTFGLCRHHQINRQP
jgi:hypothetical protein